MNDEPSLDVTPPTKRMKITPPIHLLPNELLVTIIEKLPRTQWPALELVDPIFQDAVLLAWGSVREVDIDRDFIYSDAITDENDVDDDSEMARGRLRPQIAQQTEAILKELYERSPLITSLSGLLFIADDPTLNTTAVQCLAKFEHLETINSVDIPLISLVEFVESTQSRATLKEIDLDQCRIPNNPIMVANFDQRLRAAFANDSNDPTRQLLVLQPESISMQIIGVRSPLTFLDIIDASKLMQLSLGNSHVEPAVLTTLINGAPELQHLSFDFLYACKYYANTPVCQGGRLQPNKDLLAALGSRPNLTSLGFNSIWGRCGTCPCHRFETEFKNMLQTIAPRLVNFVFETVSFPPDISMGDIRNIIQNHMPSLKSIELGNHCAKDPEELRGITDGKKLEEIELVSFYYNDDNYMSTLHDVMSTIINKSPQLKRFIGISYWPDQRVAVALCKLNDLTDLRIRADLLTEENFVAFSHQVFAEKLEVLDLGEIGEGVESGLIELIGKSNQLRELVVDGYVTDRLLECMSKSSPNLEKFCVSSAGGITFDGVQMLVEQCPKLRWLRVDDGTVASSLKNLVLDRYRKLELC